MQLRPQPLGQPAVGDLADQRVGEAEGVLAARARRGRAGSSWLRTSAISAPARSRVPAGSSSASAPRWKLRPSTEACSSSARSSGSSRSMRAASTASMVGGSVPVAADRHELLEEQRVAFRRARRSAARRSGSARHAPRRAPAPRASGQRVEREHRRAALRRRPRGPLLEQLRAAEAHEQDRRAARERGDVVDQVEQRRLGPVDVVEDDHERPVGARDRARAAAARPTPSPPAWPARRSADGGEELARSTASSPPSCGGEVLARKLADDLGQRA